MLIKNFDKIAICTCKKVGEKTSVEMLPDDPMFCCSVWQEKFVNDPRVPVSYSPVFRKYYLMVEKDLHAIFGLISCLQCGKKWPDDLVWEWGETIEKELGFDPRYKKNVSQDVPEEFITDAWWKKREL